MILLGGVAGLLLAAIAMGVRLVVVGEGQVGIQLRGGAPLNESLQRGLYVSVPGWRRVAVLDGARIRISVLKLSAPSDSGVAFHASVRLLWVVHVPEAVKFYLATQAGGWTTEQVEQALVKPALESLVAPVPPADWSARLALVNEALKPCAIKVLQIEVQPR